MRGLCGDMETLCKHITRPQRRRCGAVRRHGKPSKALVIVTRLQRRREHAGRGRLARGGGRRVVVRAAADDAGRDAAVVAPRGGEARDEAAREELQYGPIEQTARDARHTASSPGPRKQDARAHARPRAPPTAPHRTGARASTTRSAARDGDTTRLHPLEAHDELDELELVGRPRQRDHEQHAPEMAHTKRGVARRRVVPPVARAQARPRRRRCARPSCDAVRGDVRCNGAAVAKRSRAASLARAARTRRRGCARRTRAPS